MDALEAIKGRRSVREYQDKPIKKEELEKIIDAARLAPTARGEEPWEFIVITKRDKIEELAGITDHGKFMKAAPCSIAVFSRDTKYYLEDGSAATENILIAATALGIGSCWIAGDKKSYADKIRIALKVPEGFKLVSIIALGYPKEAPKARKRRLLEDVMHWESF